MSELIAGYSAPGFETVREEFARTIGARGAGAALSILRDGEVVVDLWGGTADSRSDRSWAQDTISVIFSATKGLVAILAARLVQDGLLDYEAPVSRYWPEFAQAGKENVKVKHLLSHQSGMSAPRVALRPEDILDWDVVIRNLQAQEPLWVPGEGFAYHAITYGWLIGEVIRRITGTTVGQYFQSLVASPLGVDAWIGLPSAELPRVAYLHVGATLAALVESQSAERLPDRTDWLLEAMTLGSALPPELVSPTGGFNDPALQRAEIPGAGGIASARALATIWSSTVVTTSGVRLLDDSTLAISTAVQTDRAPVFYSPPPHPRWGMGFQLDSAARRYPTSSSFGHDGAGGQVAFADPQNRIGFAYLTNLMEADDPRATRIIEALKTVLE